MSAQRQVRAGSKRRSTIGANPLDAVSATSIEQASPLSAPVPSKRRRGASTSDAPSIASEQPPTPRRRSASSSTPRAPRASRVPRVTPISTSAATTASTVTVSPASRSTGVCGALRLVGGVLVGLALVALVIL